MSDAIYYIWLMETAKIPCGKAADLITAAGSAKDVYDCAGVSLGVRLNKVEQGALTIRDLSRARSILDECKDKDIGIVTYQDEAFPQSLKEIENPPILLYYRGKWRDLDNIHGIAVVGQRRATPFGRITAEEMGYHFSKAGFCVISGLASGIDSCAHRGAVKADGFTIGVLGTGADICYPIENAGLMRTMCKSHLVITEYPPQTSGFPQNFPHRNRIVSALSRGVVVVEAQLRSGSLITARLALEQDKELFAVKGPLGSKAHEGTLKLISDGVAHPVLGYQSVLDYYSCPNSVPQNALDGIEKTVYQLLCEGKSLEKIQEIVGLSSGELTNTLLVLELDGLIVKSGFKNYKTMF